MQNEARHEISIEREMKQSYLEYAMSVIIGRALPDARDGLKPVHRRVLFAMNELSNDWNKPYKKSARIVGDVIGKYHPHGDMAVYDTMVRMAQDFSMRYMLIDGQGNFGSIDGDSPAAMRYTEVRMTRLAHEMMADLEKETVDFSPNYDGSLDEPVVLPSKFPALLVNGSSGIAVGMATNIPPHNLTEISDALIALINDPSMTSIGLMHYVKGPDFPTGGVIYGTNGIREAYETGRGIIQVRGKVEVETDEKNDSETIIITEIPYQVNKAKLIERIAELVKAKEIEGIRFVRDESDREGMRIAVGIKRDQMAEPIINQLYKHTQLQSSFGINILAVVNNRPELLNLKEALNEFLSHRKEVIVRRTRFELRKAEERAHILEGLKIALDNLDAVVALIRNSASPAEAKAGLIETFSLSAIQAQAILDMRLQRLTGLERDKIIEEYNQILKDIERLRAILSSDILVQNIIKDELTALRDSFGDARRTDIIEASGEISIEDMITEEDMVVTISKDGYIKRNPVTLYQSQKRGGKGKTAMGTKEEDFVEHLFVASTHHTFLFFTNLGRCYWLKVYEIPQSGRTSKGKALVNILNFSDGEKISAVLAVPEFIEGHYVLTATRNGIVKKSDLMAYSRPRSGGIIAVDLDEGDELISVRITDGTMDVFLATAEGQSIRFNEADVRPTGRASRGVIGINLEDNDRVVGMEVLSHGKAMFVATENGFGKRTSIDEYSVQRRGGKGVITIKTSERNGQVVDMHLVDEGDEIMLITDSGRLIRMEVAGISVISRNTQGVKLIGLEAGERLIAAARIAEGSGGDKDCPDDENQEDENYNDSSDSAEGDSEE